MPLPSEQFCKRFQEFRRLLTIAVNQALQFPSCDRLAQSVIADKDYYCRLVIIFYSSRRERSEKLLESVPRHKHLIEEIIRILPRIESANKAYVIQEKLRQEYREFGFGLIVEAKPRSTTALVTVPDFAVDTEDRRLRFLNSPKIK